MNASDNIQTAHDLTKNESGNFLESHSFICSQCILHSSAYCFIRESYFSSSLSLSFTVLERNFGDVLREWKKIVVKREAVLCAKISVSHSIQWSLSWSSVAKFLYSLDFKFFNEKWINSLSLSLKSKKRRRGWEQNSLRINSIEAN